ncbi:CD8B protein, partial [Turnix velox]|nr:CD8B protein [Turnix velox]
YAKKTSCCIFLSLFSLGFCANLLLSQAPKHILAQTNDEAEIPCELKSEHAGIYWYRWSQERQNFEFLVFSSLWGKATYGTNISQDKFSVPGARSSTSYSLHINHLHASDNGTYYCSISQSSQLLLGSGTQLNVGSALLCSSPYPPSSFPKAARAPHRVPFCIPGACSPLVWIPLATSILILLLSLVPIAHRFHRKHPSIVWWKHVGF